MAVWTLLIMLSIPNIPTESVDILELNHRYNKDADLMFDQVIAWEFVNYSITNNNGKTLVEYRPKVCFWYILNKDQYRLRLSDEEYNRRNKAYRDSWIKKYGNKGFIPRYVPPFIGGPLCPKYDPVNKRATLILHVKGKLYRITSSYYIETWTQHDPEMDNRKIFPVETRRKMLFNSSFSP